MSSKEKKPIRTDTYRNTASKANSSKADTSRTEKKRIEIEVSPLDTEDVERA